jgi:hypothetical protein
MEGLEAHNLTLDGLKVVIVPVGIFPGSGSPYKFSQDLRSRTLEGVATCIGCFLCFPSINSFVMFGQKNL